MTSVVHILLAAVALPPLALLVATPFLRDHRLVRRAMLITSGLASIAACSLFALGTLAMNTTGEFDVIVAGIPGEGALVHARLLSLPLLPVVSLTWLGGLAVAPVRTFEPAAAARAILAFLTAIGALLTTSPVCLAILLAIGMGIFLAEHRSNSTMLRVAGPYGMASSALVVSGVLASTLGVPAAASVWLVLVGLLIRQGIVPLHSWVPHSFERGRLVPAILFHCPQVGAYAAAVLVLPDASSSALLAMGILALVTTAYAAVLALAESDVRRAYGYLFMSQSALVLAGLSTTDLDGVSGALAVWVSSALGLAGFGLTIAALESRGGRQRLDHFHGWHGRMPLLSVSFLVFGLASIGFPGTLGFLGEDLLLGGSVQRFPALGYVAIGAVALNGITVMRMYFSLFCGRPAPGVLLRSRPVEVLALGSLAAVLVVGGLLPRGFVETTIGAAEATLAARE